MDRKSGLNHKKAALPNGSEVLKSHKEIKLPTLKEPIADALELDYEKACKKQAEICANGLKKVLKKMGKENPGEESYDVYRDADGRKLIRDLLRMENGEIDRKELFEYLRIKLNNLGLVGNRPYYGYFEIDNPFDYGGHARYTISEKSLGNVLAYEETCKKQAEICAKGLKEVLEKMEKENPGEESYDVYYDADGRKLIRNLLRMESGEIDRKKLFEYLRVELDNLGLVGNRPYYGYFEIDNRGHARYTIKKKEKNDVQL